MKYIYIILICNIYSNGIFSNGLEKSINFSMSYKFDNDNLYSYNENNELYVLKELKPKIYDAKLSMVFRGKYEVGYNYIFNSSYENDYGLPERGSYNYLYFIYHFKERKRFPINLSFNITSGYRKSSISANKFTFYHQKLGLSIYKEIELKTYPLVLKFDHTQVSSIYENISYDKVISDNEYNVYTIQTLIKLIVNTEENTVMRDIIWLGPKIDILDDDHFFGFDIGIYHPIK